MTSHVPRPAYSKDELERLYPPNVKLQLVQVLLRHGERAPVSARFQNAGLSPYWPYCNAAKRLSSVAMTTTDWSSWDKLEWRRRLETFGEGDASVLAAGPQGQVDGVCNLGELTDRGRETTLALGQRLRRLYVDQLNFMPPIIADADMIYLRATPMPRALESVQQSFWGMYPLTARTASFPPPTIITRTPQEENLYFNEYNCKRFGQLSQAFGQRAADRWNNSPDMDYLNLLISKWMPEKSRVAVDSHPRLSGIMDTVNSTLGHGSATRLPAEFYDKKARAIIDKIAVEEWFAGFKESNEYRTVAIGSLAGDIVARMVGSAARSRDDGLAEIGGEDGHLEKGRGGETALKFALSGCHDTSLAALMSSLGAFDDEPWPPYTSHIAFELFSDARKTATPAPAAAARPQSWFERLFGSSKPSETASPPSSRKRLDTMTESEKSVLDGHYVRVRYNDQPVTVPRCKLPGNHLESDETFCTLEAFKAAVDNFTPKSWREACKANLDQPPIPKEIERAGY